MISDTTIIILRKNISPRFKICLAVFLRNNFWHFFLTMGSGYNLDLKIIYPVA